MKKVFVVLMICLLAASMLLPCAAAAKAAATTVMFGAYPTAQVTDAAELAALNSLPNLRQSAETLPDGRVLYIRDVTCGGQKYRAVSTQAEGSKIWFRYEPIEWTVVDSDRKLSVLLCNTAIVPAPGTAPDDAVYDYLSDRFYKTAFSADEQAYIADSSEYFNRSSATYVFLQGNADFGSAPTSSYAAACSPITALRTKTAKMTPAVKQASVKGAGEQTNALRPMIVLCEWGYKPGWIISLLLHLFGH